MYLNCVVPEKVFIASLQFTDSLTQLYPPVANKVPKRVPYKAVDNFYAELSTCDHLVKSTIVSVFQDKGGIMLVLLIVVSLVLLFGRTNALYHYRLIE